MKLATYLCEFCNKDNREDKVFLVKIDYSTKPPRIAGTVPEWYCGIRVICKTCVEGLKELK